MFIITEEGKLIEGQELSIEEVEIAKELPQRIYEECTDFISQRSRDQLVRFLLSEYKLTKRSRSVEAPEPEQSQVVEIPQAVHSALADPVQQLENISDRAL